MSEVVITGKRGHREGMPWGTERRWRNRGNVKTELVASIEIAYEAAGPYPVITGNCYSVNVSGVSGVL